jgi:hypothetical protein
MILIHPFSFYEKKHDQENDEAHQHMQAVQSCHGKIEPKKEDFPFVAFQEPWRIGIDSVMNLSTPLEIFNSEEEEPEENGGGQKNLRKPLIPFLEAGNGESHGQAAGDEEERIERSEGAIQLSSSQMKIHRILEPVDRIENEQSSKEKHFRKEEKPHPDFRPGVIFASVHSHLSNCPIL